MEKHTALLFITMLTVSSLILLENAYAQSTHKPTVPEFTLQFVDTSYYFPPSTISTTNPYTNQTTTTTIPSHHVQNLTIQLTIKNQAFPPMYDGNNVQLYYNVQAKGHFEPDTWTQVVKNATQSNSAYTIFSIPANSYPISGIVDIQVEASLGYYDYVLHFPSSGSHMAFPYYEFIGQTSGWSNTQTITIPTSEPTTSTSETWQSGIIIGIVVVFVLAVGILLVYFKKRKHV